MSHTLTKTQSRTTRFGGRFFPNYVWLMLALDDLKMRYKRSVIGPFWIVIHAAVQISAIAFVFSNLFGVELEIFLPFLASGIIIWQFIAAVMTEAPQVFLEAQGLIISYNLPYQTYLKRFVTRHMIVLFHNLLIFLAVCLFYPQSLNFYTLNVFPGFLIIILNAYFVAMLFAIIGTRYRDFGQAINALTLVTFMVTPVFWDKGLLKTETWIALINPFFHFIEIVRNPLLGKPIEPLSWAVTLGITAFMHLISRYVFKRYARRITYWF